MIEQHPDTVWQRGMLMPWTRSQVSFLKDLATLRNPQSRFTFINYLHSAGRLSDFINLGSFTPYRMEISHYLQWVARSLTKVAVEYNTRCARLEPGVCRRWPPERLARDARWRCDDRLPAPGHSGRP